MRWEGARQKYNSDQTIALRETSVSQQDRTLIEGPAETPLTITALFYRRAYLGSHYAERRIADVHISSVRNPGMKYRHYKFFPTKLYLWQKIRSSQV